MVSTKIRRAQKFAKRLMDLCLVTASLPAVVPAVAIIGLWITHETQGGMFFRQTRIGQGGRPFTVLKLRTMVEGAETIGAGIYAEPGDARFTRAGLFARRYSLDELPQLWNILRGEMSIVGPRPMIPVIVDQYRDQYSRILAVKPGLTGLAQVSGRNDLPRSKRLELDMTYAEAPSLRLDLQIILRTLGVVFQAEGQRNDQGREDVER